MERFNEISAVQGWDVDTERFIMERFILSINAGKVLGDFAAHLADMDDTL